MLIVVTRSDALGWSFVSHSSFCPSFIRRLANWDSISSPRVNYNYLSFFSNKCIFFFCINYTSVNEWSATVVVLKNQRACFQTVERISGGCPFGYLKPTIDNWQRFCSCSHEATRWQSMIGLLSAILRFVHHSFTVWLMEISFNRRAPIWRTCKSRWLGCSKNAELDSSDCLENIYLLIT